MCIRDRYTVEYYEQNLDGETYTKYKTETYTTDVSEINLNALGYVDKKENFTLTEASAADAELYAVSGTVKSVIKLYYNRNTYWPVSYTHLDVYKRQL